MNALEKALDQERRFSGFGVTTYRRYFAARPPESKRTYIERRKTKDIYDYSVWWGSLGIEIPKIIYDSLDVPEEIIDDRFE